MITAIIVVLVVLLVLALAGDGLPRSGCCASTSAGWCSGSGA